LIYSNRSLTNQSARSKKLIKFRYAREPKEVPVFTEDFEEIIQTLENGVVVKEEKKIIKSPVSREVAKSQYHDVSFNLKEMEINENFETKDIDEEEKCINNMIKTHYLKAKNKHNLFEEKSQSDHRERKDISEDIDRSDINQAINQSSRFDPVSLLEESQEVVVFQSDSKDVSTRHARDKSGSSKEGFSKFSPRNEEKKEETKFEGPIVISNVMIQNHDRDSPGPRRATITSSLEK
jgi:hypothetical protein